MGDHEHGEEENSNAEDIECRRTGGPRPGAVGVRELGQLVVQHPGHDRPGRGGQQRGGVERQRDHGEHDHHQRDRGGDQLRGKTLYWFAPDTSTASKCTGSCATYWPPVTGPVTAGSGVTGTLSTITRSDGTVQATYDGHPLYTYVGDTAAGQAKGNGLNLSGGLWYEMTVSGAKPAVGTAASTPSASTPSASTGGGGYGY